MATENIKDKYTRAEHNRQKHVDAILNSPSSKNIVVAGPGTGKTYLFKMVLEGKKDTLTLSFINALVEDLSLELCGISDVKTLHGFARSILSKASSVKELKIFPDLSEKVIRKDAKILLGEEIDFDEIFHNRDDDNEYIEFYKNRKNYYKHYGFSDIVFAAVKYFDMHRHKIPNFKHVVVDEFQDFNELEVSLIDHLAKQSPILLAGDDDQALYGFKGASPKHIRQRHSEDTPDYTPFNLPYCSRCTRVIVGTANDIINHAKEEGYLSSRINKPFRYFDEEEKDKVSDKNPQIIYRSLQANQIPSNIEIDILKIAKQVRNKFTVLIICPYNKQCRTVANALKKKGFANVSFTEKEGKIELTLLDGLKLLLEDNSCNLGWRIVAEKMLEEIEFENLIKKTNENDAKDVSELIEKELKREVKQMLTTLRAVREGREIEESKLANLFKSIDIDAFKMVSNYLKDEIKFCVPPSQKVRLANPAIRKIPITITTTQRSKGLAADYVFITYFDDRYFLEDKDKVSDQDICKFLVALTRARKKAFLYSSDVTKKPVFLEWIDKGRIGDG